MLRRACFFLAVVLLSLALGPNGGGVPPARAASGSALQTFDVDALMCLGEGPLDLTQIEPAVLPLECSNENKTPSAEPEVGIGMAVNEGERLGLVLMYTASGWDIEASEDVGGGLANDQYLGGVIAHTNLGCDENKDILASAAGPAVPATVWTRTVNWGPGTGYGGTDESYLDALLPPDSLMEPTARYRADIDTIWYSGMGRPLIPPLPLNSVVMHPVWSPEGAQVTVVVPWVGFGSPTAGVLCVDSPQISSTSIAGAARGNPSSAGLYAAWVTLLSPRDLKSGEQHFVYTTNCKAIGGSVTDADHDCWDDAVDSNTGNADQDGDLLLDGIEVAWGTCPNDSFVFTAGTHGFDLDCSSVSNPYDTDGDGRTDLEEMIGPITFLANPRLADTDGDGVDDGGLLVDANDDGAPDCPDEDGDGTCDSGIGSNSDTSGDGSSHVRVGVRIEGSDIEQDAAGNDNCPSTPNGPAQVGGDPEDDNQVNTDYDSATEHGNGDLFGDVCDDDNDEDGIVDQAELTFVWDEDEIGAECNEVPGAAIDDDGDGFVNEGCPAVGAAEKRDEGQCWTDTNDDDGDGKVNDGCPSTRGCSNVPPQPGPATPLDPLDFDSDGDGYVDGPECHLGSIPNDPGSTPSPMSGQDNDSDGLNKTYERFIRTRSFSGVPEAEWDVDGDGVYGDGDLDSDADGIVDQCEALVTSTHPLNTDSDRDDTPDYAEPGIKMRIWIGNGKGLTLPDRTVPWDSTVGNELVCSAPGADFDGDGLDDADEAAGTACAAAGGPSVVTDSIFPLDVTYDDDGDGTMLNGSDDGPSWDTDGDGVLDGAECTRGTDPTNVLSKPDTAACGGTSDTDGDGLKDAWENCKWGTDPADIDFDTDGDGTGDCQEAADVNGDGTTNFVGDVIAYARSALLPDASFGKDGDFDINGDATVNFVGDVIQEARFGLLPGLCK